MRRLWVSVFLGILWTPVQFVSPVPINGWKGFASVGLTSVVVVAVALVATVVISRPREVAKGGTKGAA